MAFDLIEKVDMALFPMVERRSGPGPQIITLESLPLALINLNVVSLRVPADPAPAGDVTLDFFARGYLHLPSDYVDVGLNQELDWGGPDPPGRYAKLWGEAELFCEVLSAQLIVPLATWAAAAAGGDMVIYMRPWTTDDNYCDDGDFIQVHVTYEHQAPGAEDPEPYFGWASLSDKVLAGEPAGVPHRLRGRWAVDPRTAELGCLVESLGGEVFTVGGLGAVGATNAAGNEQEAGMGAPMTAEIGGVLIGASTRQACPQE